MYKFLFFFTFLVLVLSGCKDQNQGRQEPEELNGEVAAIKTTPEAIAHRYGVDNWKDVSVISFTFNTERGENHRSRSYTWYPKKGDVTFIRNSDTLVYNRKSMDSLERNSDRYFVNDSYWLLAAFKMVWDDGTQYSDEDTELAPISKERLQKVTLVYGVEGGYTPGDAYDYYYNSDFMVKEWVYRRGNKPEPGLTMTWENDTIINGIKLPLMHRDSTDSFRLYFTNVSIQ